MRLIVGPIVLDFHSLSFSLCAKRGWSIILFVLQAISPLQAPVRDCEFAPTRICLSVKLEQSKNTISRGRHSVFLRDWSIMQQSTNIYTDTHVHTHIQPCNQLGGLVKHRIICQANLTSAESQRTNRRDLIRYVCL